MNLLGNIAVTGDANPNVVDFSGVTASSLGGFFLTIDGVGGDDTITGSNLGDHIFGGAGNNTLNGGDGADTIHADGGGTNTVDAGAGDDDVFFNGAINSAAQLQGGTGTDTLELNGAVTLNAASFSPAAQGFEQVHLLSNITITGDNNANVVDFSGLPVSSLGGFLLTVNGAGGDDTITGSNLGDHIFGGIGVNTLNGGDGADTIHADGAAPTRWTRAPATTTFSFKVRSIPAAQLQGGTGTDTLNSTARSP